MKLRLLDNTIRFRLSRPEVEQLVAGQRVSAQTKFPADATLKYELIPNSDVDAMWVSFISNVIRVSIPAALAKSFADDGAITLEDRCADNAVSVKIEKDFQCLAPRDEDESKLFKHPRA